MRVLLVEPWLTGSHQSWAEGYAARSAHDVHVVAHEGAYWRWRLRGGAVTLAEEAARVVAEHGRPDVVLASSMLDVPAFIGQARGVVVEYQVYAFERSVRTSHVSSDHAFLQGPSLLVYEPDRRDLPCELEVRVPRGFTVACALPRRQGWVNVAVASLAMTATLPGRTHGLGLVTEPMLSDLQLDPLTFARIDFR